MGDGTPGFDGIGLVAGSRTSSRSESRYGELAITTLECASNCSGLNASTNATLPDWILPTYSSDRMPSCERAGTFIGLGPLGLAYLRNPRPLTRATRPSGNARAAVGYHPVGINPCTWLCSPSTSLTATP